MTTTAEPSSYQLMILSALQRNAHVYSGTVPTGVKARRRAAHLVAKRSRKTNRGLGDRRH